MLAVPVFLTLFMMGAALNLADRDRTLAYTGLPQGHWILAILLFVVTGAMLPLGELDWTTGVQALGLILMRGLAKFVGVVGTENATTCRSTNVGWWASASSRCQRRPSSWPPSPPCAPRSAASRCCSLIAAAMMEFVGPQLCKRALQRAGETEPTRPEPAR